MIGLALIARDEERCLERCLRSVAPFVDDMVVVDTGSRDASARIAAACGARVFGFSWCDDFSAARNHALEQLRTDWVLVLDADEWIEAGGAALRAALEAAGAPFVGQVRIDNTFDDGPEVRTAPSWLSRILPREVRYAGRIHEQPVHRFPVRRTPLVVGHDGYRAAQQAGKAGRNERLLRQLLGQQPADPYLQYQLGKDLEVQGRFAEAADCYAGARAAALARAGRSGRAAAAAAPAVAA